MLLLFLMFSVVDDDYFGYFEQLPLGHRPWSNLSWLLIITSKSIESPQEVMSEGLAPSFHATNIFRRARRDLMCLYYELTRCYSEDHGQIQT